MSTSTLSNLRIGWLFKMAWRDARASKLRLSLFMASIVLGIGAVVSIQLFSINLTANIKLQSKALMGADYIIESDQIPTERAQAIIDSLKPDASEINFVSMVSFPKSGDTKLAKVRGLEGAFPFYGTIDTQPEIAGKNFQKLGGALVDATLMLQYGVEKGDLIKIGELTLPIIGALEAIPGTTAISSSVAPPVIIPREKVAQTELLQMGSRKEYQYFFNRPAANLDVLEDKIEPILDDEEADLDTHTSTSRRLGRRYENVGNFLNLAAFIALLLGCVGIASSVNIYIKEKIPSIAILKSMGASRLQGFLIYLIQVSGIGLLGGIMGTAIGIALQELFPVILAEFLPFEIEIQLYAQPLIMGCALGILVAVLFALLPLMRTWYVTPLEVLRVGQSAKASPQVTSVIFVTLGTFLYLFSFWLLDDWLRALYFLGAIGLTFIILSGTALGVMKLVKKLFPHRAAFTTRQALSNLFRPNNQTLVLIVSIGLGTFLISTLYFTKDILLQKTEVGTAAQEANLIALDVQPDQLEKVTSIFEQNNVPVVNNIPLVTMRIQNLKGASVNALRKNDSSEIRGWVLNHEFRTTYRDHLSPSEEIIAGEWQERHTGNGSVKISISDNLAEDAQLDVGDVIVFNVQGVLMDAVVGSIRQVDWTNLQVNFSIVFPEGAINDAPQFNVISAYADSAETSARLQRTLVSALPSVTIIDLRQVFTIVDDILQKISWVINFMAFFSIITGLIVLMGSVRTSKYQRIKESVLLRTLGAKSKQILRITLLEYLFLGLLGSVVGILLALVGSFLLAAFVFQEPFFPTYVPFLIFIPSITLIVTVIGLSNIREVLRSSPLQVLRKTQAV